MRIVVKTFLVTGLLFSSHFSLANVCDQTKGRAESSLVIAMDLSGSMDTNERSVQLRGYADSIQDPKVIDNLLNCTCTEVAIVFWGASPRLEFDFKLMETREDIDNLTKLFSQLSKSSAYDIASVGETTQLYDALKFSSKIVQESGQSLAQQTILISGDGYDSRLYANLEDLKTLKKTHANSGIKVYGVPIDIHNFTEDAAETLSSPRSAIVSSGNNQTQMDYPEVSDFYKKEVVTSSRFLSVAKDSSDLERALTSALTQLTCNVSM